MTRTGSSDDRAVAARSAGVEALGTVESLNARRELRDRRDGPGRRQIPAEDLEQIVRRAADLQNRHGNPGSQLLTESEVVEIGRQVGLGADYVRRAIAEVHAESLAPKPAPGNRVLDLIAGESRVEVRRVVAGDPAAIQQQLEMQLRDREKLSALRHRPRRSLWEASSGTFDRLERFLNFSGREYALAETRRVDLAVTEIEPGWSLVTMGADISNKRDEVLYWAAGLIAAFAIAAGSFAGEGDITLFGIGAALLVGVLGAAVGIPWVRRIVHKRRERVALILESLVDRADR